jgi:hypothetical protein
MIARWTWDDQKVVTIVKKGVLVLILIIVIAAAVSATIYWILQNGASTNGQPDALPTNKYLFVEHEIQTLASLPGSNDTFAVYSYLGYPTFSYNQSVIAASSLIFPAVNDSLRAIYQYGTIVGPGGCHGANYSIAGAYGLPYMADPTDGVQIVSTDSSGNAYLIYNGKPIVIRPQGIWYNNQSAIENVVPLNSTDGRPIEVNITVIDRITNFGICDK